MCLYFLLKKNEEHVTFFFANNCSVLHVQYICKYHIEVLNSCAHFSLLQDNLMSLLLKAGKREPAGLAR